VTADELKRDLVRRNTDKGNLEAGAKLAFLRDQGSIGAGAQRAVTAVAHWHRECLALIQLDDAVARSAPDERKNALASLVSAERWLAQSLDRELRDRGLERDWSDYRAKHFPRGYEIDVAEAEKGALTAPGMDTSHAEQLARYNDPKLRRAAQQAIEDRAERRRKARLKDPLRRPFAVVEPRPSPPSEQQIRREIDRMTERKPGG